MRYKPKFICYCFSLWYLVNFVFCLRCNSVDLEMLPDLYHPQVEANHLLLVNVFHSFLVKDVNFSLSLANRHCWYLRHLPVFLLLLGIHRSLSMLHLLHFRNRVDCLRVQDLLQLGDSFESVEVKDSDIAFPVGARLVQVVCGYNQLVFLLIKENALDLNLF